MLTRTKTVIVIIVYVQRALRNSFGVTTVNAFQDQSAVTVQWTVATTQMNMRVVSITNMINEYNRDNWSEDVTRTCLTDCQCDGLNTVPQLPHC